MLRKDLGHVVDLMKTVAIIPIFYFNFLAIPTDVVVSTLQITARFLLLSFGNVRNSVSIYVSTKAVLSMVLISQVDVFHNLLRLVTNESGGWNVRLNFWSILQRLVHGVNVLLRLWGVQINQPNFIGMCYGKAACNCYSEDELHR